MEKLKTSNKTKQKQTCEHQKFYVQQSYPSKMREKMEAFLDKPWLRELLEE